MKILKFLPVPALLFLSFTDSDNGERVYSDKTVKATYHVAHGMLNGSYVSFYPNGKKKAEGQFLNNERSGEWTVWNSSGKKLMSRKYGNDSHDANDFVLSFPAPKGNGFQYVTDEEMKVTYSKRVWRYIPVGEQPWASFTGAFYHELVDSLHTTDIRGYADDELQTPQPAYNYVQASIDSRLVGFRIKEDFYYDSLNESAETDIVAICPVVRYPSSADSVDLAWINYAGLYNLLDRAKVSGPAIPKDIVSLSDVFQYRFFTSEIYMELNVKHQRISDYATGAKLKKEQERIEIEMIETEHDKWIADYAQ